jgi:hypothetical protein
MGIQGDDIEPRVVTASDCYCPNHNSLGCHPSTLRHSGISEAADEAVFDKVQYLRLILLTVPAENHPAFQ